MYDEKFIGIQQTINASPGTIIESRITHTDFEDHSPYTMVHRIRDKTIRIPYMDIIDCLTKISKAALLLFNDIKLNRDPKTGIAVMDHFNSMDKSQLRATYRKLVELQEADLVLKVHEIKDISALIDIPGFNLKAKPKKFSYMINPKLLHPKATKGEKTYGPALVLWELLKTTKPKEHTNDNSDKYNH